MLAVIYFASGNPSDQAVPFHTWRRVAVRHPRFVLKAAWAGGIRVVTNAPIAHVLIGDGYRVLSPNPNGHKVWPAAGMPRYKGLVDALVLRVPRRIDIDRHRTGPFGPAQNIGRWLTRGLYDPADCIGVVSAILRDAGAPVPRLASPVALYDWIMLQPNNPLWMFP